MTFQFKPGHVVLTQTRSLAHCHYQAAVAVSGETARHQSAVVRAADAKMSLKTDARPGLRQRHAMETRKTKLTEAMKKKRWMKKKKMMRAKMQMLLSERLSELEQSAQAMKRSTPLQSSVAVCVSFDDLQKRTLRTLRTLRTTMMMMMMMMEVKKQLVGVRDDWVQKQTSFHHQHQPRHWAQSKLRERWR
jgi:hypothetical protein